MEKLQVSSESAKQNTLNSSTVHFYLLLRLIPENIVPSLAESDQGDAGLHKNNKEVWFTIPIDKIDCLYLLFLQWYASLEESQPSLLAELEVFARIGNSRPRTRHRQGPWHRRAAA